MGLIWTSAEPTNLPLNASSGEVAELARACRLAAVHLPFGFFGFSIVPMVEEFKDGILAGCTCTRCCRCWPPPPRLMGC
jgi:hypothetical protein